MADIQLLEAINGIKNAMKNQLKTVPTKPDLNSLVGELRGVKELVIRNKNRIDMRKEDGERLAKKVEQIVDIKIATTSRQQGRTRQPSELEQNFLRSRRSVRMWPVSEAAGLEKGVKKFLGDCLAMPEKLIESLTFEKIEKQGQVRRSNVKSEVLVMLETSQQ